MIDPRGVWLAATLGAYALGALVATLLRRQTLAYALAAAGGAAGLGLSARVLAEGRAYAVRLPAGVAPGGAPGLLLDPLAAFFLLLISLGGLLASLYAIGYHARDASTPLRPRVLGSGHNLFLLSMTLVVAANDVVSFLIAWETMSIVSFVLVLLGESGPEGRRAALVYLVMTHVGTALILLAFLMLANAAGSLSFDALRTAGSTLDGGLRSLAFLCAFVGFGTKAGVVPLHGWLPLAHPAAPTSASALMSGVMIKTGIYMIVRFAFTFLGVPHAWWGALVLVAGALSALLGVLFALAQHDLKRLLAFHSVENIGIILLGVGAALLFASRGHALLAAFALAAGLFHTLNHMVFKTLLFLGAGAVAHGARTRDIEEMGGLARRMPWTATFFLVGAAAISALPPLNGFASEWATFQSLVALLALGTPAPGAAALVVSAAALLALTSALAAACFVKAYGIVFGGVPRSEHARHAHEAGATMLVPMGILALLCAALGVGAGVAFPIIQRVTNALVAPPGSLAPTPLAAALPSALPGVGSLAPLVLVALLGAGALVAFAATRLAPRRTSVRSGSVWACGETTPTARHEITATAFAAPLLEIFAPIYRTRTRLDEEKPREAGAAPRMRYLAGIQDVFERSLIDTPPHLLKLVALRARRIQSGSLQAYILYVLIALLVVLAVI